MRRAQDTIVKNGVFKWLHNLWRTSPKLLELTRLFEGWNITCTKRQALWREIPLWTPVSMRRTKCMTGRKIRENASKFNLHSKCVRRIADLWSRLRQLLCVPRFAWFIFCWKVRSPVVLQPPHRTHPPS